MSGDGDAGDGVLASLLGYLALMSLMAVGGGVIMLAPDMHRYVVEAREWITGEQFAAAFTIAQASPGPNVLFVTLIGLQVGGIVGALGATFAILMPTFFLTLVVVRWIPLRPAGRLGKAVRNGLAPISIGLLAAGGLVLARAADTGFIALLLTVGAVAALVTTRCNPVWLIAAGAVVGIGMGL